MPFDAAFAHELVKGKITEQLADLFFRGLGFDVFPYGYESTLTYVAQHRAEAAYLGAYEAISHSPDFVITKHWPNNTRSVYLAEIKFRSHFKQNEILEIAQRIIQQWNPCYLFLATPDQLYFDSVRNIIDNHGQMATVAPDWATQAEVDSFLQALGEFIHPRVQE